MFGSIYIGLSGLSAYSRGLQQISNNLANLNSQGFKGSTVSFQNLLGSGDRSGGHGVQNTASRISFAPGELRQTDRDLDLAVQGTGMLMLMRGNDTFYTRTGSFDVDKDGFIVLTGTDYRLATLNDAGQAVSLSIDGKRTGPPKATTSITFADNLSSTATTYNVADVAVYDPAGTKHVWQIKFDKRVDPSVTGNVWKVSVTDDKGKVYNSQTLKFGTNGAIDPTTASLTFADETNGLSVVLDFSKNTTSFSGGSVSTLRAASVDGYTVGTLTTITVNTDGKLEIGYSNGQKDAIGSVAIAEFRDTSQLEQQAGGLFTDKGGSQRMLLPSGDVRTGKVQARRLEASNVDLTLEFSDLILVQRGFQASSQIISVSNDMIQQLFGIRGQG
jgi:flagellar hook protein FlgE